VSAKGGVAVRECSTEYAVPVCMMHGRNGEVSSGLAALKWDMVSESIHAGEEAIVTGYVGGVIEK